ncbi:hypothetical protein [Aliamphritea spongicola]|nr:hypothetical protein [Aliamphritea spongicola]
MPAGVSGIAVLCHSDSLTSYFIAKQYGSDFVADYALKFFDVLVSALIIISLVALLEFALVIATGDGQLPLPAISVGSLTMITGMLALLYSFVMSIIFMLFPLMGSELKIPVSLRVFEILRGAERTSPVPFRNRPAVVSIETITLS